MVTITDIGQVNMFHEELVMITRALDHLDHGGRIVQMMIMEADGQGGAPIGDRGPAIVDTRDMSYPQAMVEAIKGELGRRRDAIENQLQNLGVTGVAARRT